MIFYNYVYCILIAYIWILNKNSLVKNKIINTLIILIITVSSFNSIFIHSKINLSEGLIFYLNQENILDLIVFKEILFFSKKGIENIIIIIILVFILKIIQIKNNTFFKKKILKILLPISIIINPIMIDLIIENNYYENDIHIRNVNLQKHVNHTYKNNYYDENINNKNIIYFVIESLNKEFIENKNLMPFLNDLSKKSINFENVNELDLTNYTTSGLYALLCGNLLPDYKIFNQMKCLPDILFENEYDLSFIRADLDLLSSHINDKGEIKSRPYKDKIEMCDFECFKKKTKLDDFHVWGVHDELIFKETLNLIKKNIEKKNKFALIVKTVDTHIEGYPSKNCKKNEYFDSKIARSFYCLDNLFKKFFNELENLKNINDTIIVITSDHLLMNETFSDKFGPNKSNLFLIYDLQSQKYSSIKKKSSKLDIPATVLDTLGIANKLGVGVSNFDSNQNLIQKYDKLNLILNKQKNSVVKREIKIKEKIKNIIKIKLKKIFSDDIYTKIKKNYHKFNQIIAMVKYKYLSKNFFKRDLNLDNYTLIAHAGGQIDDSIYTNSLEAINLSLNKGFKYIELDFLKTSDGHYVAVHDWKKWLNFTDYNGELPPTLENFKKYQILNKYTPLSIYDVNKWIRNKPEIILVTDKVKSPKDFLIFYNFTNQLIMEVFDYEAIVEAEELSIDYTVSDIFLYKNLPLNRNLLEKLNTLGVRKLSASNIVINKDINFFIEAKNDMGMDIFFYQLSDDLKNIKKDQIKFLCNYPDLLSGGYFETANFKENLKC